MGRGPGYGTIHELGDHRIARVPADGPLLKTGGDAIELMYTDEGADWIALPAERLDPSFFDLRTGVAGEFLQKFVNYGRRLAIVGDISAAVERSDALRDFVRECNRGRQLRFVADAGELEGHIA